MAEVVSFLGSATAVTGIRRLGWAFVLLMQGITASIGAEAPGCLVRVPSDEPMGWIRAFHQVADGPLLVGTDRGLFRIDGDSVVRVPSDEETSRVTAFHQVAGDDGLLLVGAEEGLFRFDGERTVRVPSDQPTARVEAFYQVPGDDGPLLVGVEEGLFRFDGERTVRIPSDQPTARVEAFYQVASDDGPLLVGAGRGLFRFDGERTVRVPSDWPTARVEAFYQVAGDDGPLLIGADEGLFHFDGRRTVWVPSAGLTGDVNALHQVGGDDGPLLVGADGGLFRLDGERTVRVRSDEPTGWVYAFHQVGGGDGPLLVGARDGLFRFDGRRTVGVLSAELTGWVSAFHQVGGDGGPLLVGAEGGLFRLSHEDVRIPSAPSSFRSPESALNNAEPALILLDIEHPCARWVDVEVRLVKDTFGRGGATAIDWLPASPLSVERDHPDLRGGIQGKHAALIDLKKRGKTLEPGAYHLQARATLGTAVYEPVPIGGSIRIGEHPVVEVAKGIWGHTFGSAAIILVAALAVGRLSGALYRRLFPLRFLRLASSLASATDIKLGSFTVSPSWLIGASRRHSPRVLAAWVHRNLERVREAYGRKPSVIPQRRFVPLPVVIEPFRNEADPPTDLPTCLRREFSETRPRLLVIGEGGSGKTALATWIGHGVLEPRDSDRLGAPFRIPVVIDADLPEQVSVIDRVEQILNVDYQVDWLDRPLVSELVKEGYILLILDRLSELSDSTRDKLRPGHPDFPNAAFIVTSRVQPEYDSGTARVLRPALLSGKSLSQFVFDYVPGGAPLTWTSVQKHHVVSKIESAFGEKPTTVLFVKLAIDKLRDTGIDQSIRRSDLIRDYVRRLDSSVESRPPECTWPAPLRDAQTLAWATVRNGFRLRELPREEAEEALNGENAAVRLNYLVSALQLFTWTSAETAVTAVLDPVVEHLAALQVLGLNNAEDTGAWRVLAEAIKAEARRLKASHHAATVDGFVGALRALAFEIDPSHPLCALLPDPDVTLMQAA